MAKTQKAVRFFFGRDSYGRHTERAQALDGQWFARHDESTQWGPKSTKWYLQAPSWETSTSNAYSGEVTQHPDEPVMCWGFNRMTECSDVPRVRLPL